MTEQNQSVAFAERSAPQENTSRGNEDGAGQRQLLGEQFLPSSDQAWREAGDSRSAEQKEPHEKAIKEAADESKRDEAAKIV